MKSLFLVLKKKIIVSDWEGKKKMKKQGTLVAFLVSEIDPYYFGRFD